MQVEQKLFGKYSTIWKGNTMYNLSGRFVTRAIAGVFVGSSLIFGSAAFAHDTGHSDGGHDEGRDQKSYSAVEVDHRRDDCVPKWRIDSHGNHYQEDECN